MKRVALALALCLGACDAPAGADLVDGGAAIDLAAAAPSADASPAPDGGSPCDAPGTLSAATVRAFVETLPHPLAFSPLDPMVAAAVQAAARALLDGDSAAAAAHAAAASYAVTPLAAGGECLWVLGPTAAAPAGQGTLLVRSAWQRDLVLEAPHVPNDHNTDREAALVFAATGARALLVAGADRCAVTTASGCHPNAQCPVGFSVESDPAHSIHSAFHAMHLGVAAGASVALQLHTNLEPTLNGDALLSNGTSAPFPGSRAERLWKAWKALLDPSLDVRACSDPVAPPPAGAFCGTTNAQGLASNGGADACMGALAPAASDRFLHLEQNSRRLDDVDAWSARLASAVLAAF